MSTFRIALANLPYPSSPDEAVSLAVYAIASAANEGAGLVCFPECFVPGYRWPGKAVPPPDRAFLDLARDVVADAAKEARIGVI
ncbi:MAG: nitrilase-related carbon-nitrogen hydrolase, partial [Planctomycetota bacterium]